MNALGAYWQNLNEGPPDVDGRVSLGAPTHGRASVTVGPTTARVEWHVGGVRRLGIGLDLGPGEHGARLHVAAAPCALYLGATGPVIDALAARLVPDDEPRAVSAYAAAGDAPGGGPLVTWNLGTPTRSGRRETPRWRAGSAALWPALFGPAASRARVLADEAVVVPMPEGSYPGRVLVEETIWTRPRWPGVWKRVVRARVSVPGGVPIPGRGEHAWDQDDDRIYELHTAARTVAAAVGACVAEALEERARHADADWRPAPTPRGAGGARREDDDDR